MPNPIVAALLLTAVCSTTATAQDKPPSPTPSRTQAKVTVVISRHASDKKIISSLPYMFGVTSGDGTNVRMGSDVPITSKPLAGAVAIPQGVSYRSVGTNIDCFIDAAPDASGAYRLRLAVEDSSVHLDPAQKAANPAYTSELPSFRTFKANFIALVRDGQTMQHTTATDPVSGEVMRIDVTLNLLK